jgi:hypothetical protein
MPPEGLPPPPPVPDQGQQFEQPMGQQPMPQQGMGQQPPPGSTHATFASTTDMQWEVAVDQQPACVTPCALWVPPLSYITMRTNEFRPVRLDVGHLSGGSVMVQAEPLASGAYAAGVTFTALSGMGLITGISLTAVGCATDMRGMCTAGIITGLASGLGLYGSILLMKSAVPKAHIGPAQPYVAGTQVGLAGTF